MTTTNLNNFHKNITAEEDERLFYALFLMGLPGHIILRTVFLSSEIYSQLLAVGPYGIWLMGNDYLGGVIYQDNGILLRKQKDLDSDGNRTDRIEFLEEVEAKWLAEKEAIEDVLSSIIPHLFELYPNLIRGGVFMAVHDIGEYGTLPAAYGMDEDLEDMNNDLGCPCDINGHPIEPILTDKQVQLLAGFLYGNSLNIMENISEKLILSLYSDQGLEELSSYIGDPDGMKKCIERMTDMSITVND